MYGQIYSFCLYSLDFEATHCIVYSFVKTKKIIFATHCPLPAEGDGPAPNWRPGGPGAWSASPVPEHGLCPGQGRLPDLQDKGPWGEVQVGRAEEGVDIGPEMSLQSSCAGEGEMEW